MTSKMSPNFKIQENQDSGLRVDTGMHGLEGPGAAGICTGYPEATFPDGACQSSHSPDNLV